MSSRRIRHTRYVTCLAAAALAASLACDREERRFREVPPTATAYGAVTLDEHLQPGVRTPDVDVVNAYEGNAWAISEGKRLFEYWNCVGCHSKGGGGMGPPLMDAEWVYGADPENIVASIVEGRPNGMPSFRGRISNQQLWQLTAYVRSLSGLGPKPAKSGRDDNMQVKVDEQRTPPQPPSASASRVLAPKSERP
jgi:cytochrome c oxidase cbb3-type subunit 3